MSAMMRGMTGGGMMGSSQGRELPVARFVVAAGAPTTSDPPSLPQPRAPLRGGQTEPLRGFAFDMMQGTLNGRAFDMAAVDAVERLPLDEESVWNFCGARTGRASLSRLRTRTEGLWGESQERRSERRVEEDCNSGLVS